MKHVFVVCQNIGAAMVAQQDSFKSFQKVYGEGVTMKPRHLQIETDDIRLQFISSEASRELVMGKTIHNVVFHCDEGKVAYGNPLLYRELLVRRSREGFLFEFTLAHTIFE